MNILLFILTVAGLASGIAILTVLRRRAGASVAVHNSEECAECTTGFLCPTALSEANPS